MAAAFGKKKWNSIKLGKGMIFLNGLVSSSYIACFIPSVLRFIVPNHQSSTMNSIARTNTNYLILANICLGITNLMTLPNFDVSSTIQSIKSNIFTYAAMLLSQFYHYKYYPHSYKKAFYISSIAVNTFLLLLSIYSNNKLENAFPNQTLRSLVRIPHKTKKKTSSPASSNSTGNDGDVEDNDEYEYKSTFHKQGSTFWAQYYTEGTHELQLELGSDDMFSMKHANLCVSDSRTAGFKLSQTLKSVVIEKCEQVSIEITEEVANIDMVNCDKCTIYVRKKAPLISVENCKEPKLILYNVAVNSKPTIMSSNCTNFAVDLQKQESEESDWKTVMIPFQLKTEINPEHLTQSTVTVGL